jgi:hypothetical protein
MDAWFPDLNARGEIIAGGGVGEIWWCEAGGAWQQVNDGTHPKFVDPDWVVFAHGDSTRLLNLRSGEVRDRRIGYTQYAGGGRRWAGFYQAATTHLDLYQTIDLLAPNWSLKNGGKCALSRSGHLLYYDNFSSATNRMIYDDQVLAVGAAVDLSLCDQGAVWTFATSVHGRAVYFWPLKGSPVNISVQADELLPVIAEGPQGPWVVTGTHDGTCARRAGETYGYFRAGDLFNPAAQWHAQTGVLRVVGSSSTGQPLEWRVDPRTPPIDLTTLRPDPPRPPTPTPRPTVQIVHYPATVIAGQPAHCTAAVHGGPATRLSWLNRSARASTWHIDTVSTNLHDTTHDYYFHLTGDQEIAARVEGPGGSDQTAQQRIIHVVPPTPVTRSDRFWFGPNLASVDLATLATRPDDWHQARDAIGSITLYAQHFHDDIAATGVNTYSALKAAGLWTKITDWHLPLTVEIGVIKDWDPHGLKSLDEIDYVLERASAAGVTVATFMMDEPLTGNTGAAQVPLEEAADIVTTFMETCGLRGVPVGWAEAWPHIPLLTQDAFLDLLHDRGQVPRCWHLDIDRRRAANEHKDVRLFLQHAQAIGRQAGVPVGVYLVGYDYLTDAEYGADVRVWADDVRTMAPDVARVIVQSWARRGTDGPQDLPRNLSESAAASHTALVNAVIRRFATLPPPPSPRYPLATVYTRS